MKQTFYERILHENRIFKIVYQNSFFSSDI